MVPTVPIYIYKQPYTFQILFAKVYMYFCFNHNLLTDKALCISNLCVKIKIHNVKTFTVYSPRHD